MHEKEAGLESLTRLKAVCRYISPTPMIFFIDHLFFKSGGGDGRRRTPPRRSNIWVIIGISLVATCLWADHQCGPHLFHTRTDRQRSLLLRFYTCERRRTGRERFLGNERRNIKLVWPVEARRIRSAGSCWLYSNRESYASWALLGVRIY